jgi:hypothetical protein
MIVGKSRHANEMYDPSSSTKYKASPSAGKAVVPTSTDILCGKGHEKNHPGNCLFKLSVFPFVDTYAKAQSKVVKMLIVTHIVNLLSFKGMRFLKKSDVHNHWYVASQKMGRDKIGHFLRLRRHPQERRLSPASFLLSTVWLSSSSLFSSSSTDVLQQPEGSSGTNSAKEDVHSTATTDCMLTSRSMACDSKGANESQVFLQFPACHEEHHNTPYQVITGAHTENLYEPNKGKLQYSSNGSPTTVYRRQEFDSPLLKNSKPAASSTSSYNMQKYLEHDHKDGLLRDPHDLLKADMYTLSVPADSEEEKHETMLRNASKGMPPPFLADIMEQEDLPISLSTSSSIDDDYNQPSSAMSGSMALSDDSDEPLFGEQDLAVRLDWLGFPSNEDFL